MTDTALQAAFSKLWMGQVSLHSIQSILHLRRSDAMKLRYHIGLPDRDHECAPLSTCSIPHNFRAT